MSRFRVRRRGRPPHPDVLTPAEWRVLDGVRDGRSNAEIAERLGVSVNTVRYHVSNMLAKLGVADRQALAAWRGEPAEAPRRLRGLAGLAFLRPVAFVGALAIAALLMWLAIDRLSGTSSEVPASLGEATVPAEVTPASDDGNVLQWGIDDPFTQDGRFWARAFLTGSTHTGPPLVTVAHDGSTFVTLAVGAVESKPGSVTAQPGGSELIGYGSVDILLVRLEANGAHVWSRFLGGPGDDYPGGMALAQDGSLLVSGTFEDGRTWVRGQ